MSAARATAAVAALCAVAAAGCGVGPGEDAGEVELTVTRDYGAQQLTRANESISESDTVLRVLDRSAEVETRYGGGFVQSIDGLAGDSSDGRRTDWFFYVNGLESPIGAAEYDLSDGDRVWWDHHDWSSAMRVPAVVGSWPEPFVHGSRGEHWATELDCRTAAAACADVADALSSEGVRVSERPGEAKTGSEAGDDDAIRVVVGAWNRISSDPDARLLAEGPSRSGVFAAFSGPGPTVLTLLNQRAEPVGSIGRGAGLIAAVRRGDGPPAWLVTGTDAAGVEEAARTLGDQLEDRFAVVTEPGTEPVGVPLP